MLEAFDTGSARKNLIETIAIAPAGMSLLVIHADDEARPFFTNWTINVTAGTAVGIAVLVSIRQGVRGLYGSAHAALAAGLGLWLAAELLWTYYQLGPGIDVPFPSVADALRLAGYIAIAATLFWHKKFFIFDNNKLKKVWQSENR